MKFSLAFKELNDNWPPQWPDHNVSDAEAVTDCIQNDVWSRGTSILKFEQDFAAFLGVRFAMVVTNATHGLCLALHALGIGMGDEVIVPTLTWPTTAVAVLDSGAKPVLADIDRRTYCLDIESFEARITSRTKAVVPVHLYCSAADMETLVDICKKKNISILEDAAQCVGARWNSKALGCIGEAGVFSFHEKKLLPCGEGGCVVTNNNKIYERLYQLRDYGRRAPKYSSDMPLITGGNNRIASYQAALLSSRLKYLNIIIQKEAENAELLKSELSDIDELRAIESPTCMSLQTFYSFCWKLKRIRNDMFLQRAIINTGIKWDKPYVPLNREFIHFCNSHPIGKALSSIGDDYKAPVSDNAFEKEGIRFHHSILLAGKERIKWFGKMIRKTIEECYRDREFK